MTKVTWVSRLRTGSFGLEGGPPRSSHPNVMLPARCKRGVPIVTVAVFLIGSLVWLYALWKLAGYRAKSSSWSFQRARTMTGVNLLLFLLLGVIDGTLRGPSGTQVWTVFGMLQNVALYFFLKSIQRRW